MNPNKHASGLFICSRQGILLTGGRRWYRMCYCLTYVSLVVSKILQNIFLSANSQILFD
jgi:hypothetical protein